MERKKTVITIERWCDLCGKKCEKEEGLLVKRFGARGFVAKAIYLPAVLALPTPGAITAFENEWLDLCDECLESFRKWARSRVRRE